MTIEDFIETINEFNSLPVIPPIPSILIKKGDMFGLTRREMKFLEIEGQKTLFVSPMIFHFLQLKEGRKVLIKAFNWQFLNNYKE